MFETDDDFDLEEAFLQDVFASECQPLKSNPDTNCTVKRTSPDINNSEHDTNKKKQRFAVNKKESVQDECLGNIKKSKGIEDTTAQQRNLIDVTSVDSNSGQQRRHFDETPKSGNVDAGLKRFSDSTGFVNTEQRDLASLGSTSSRIVGTPHTESLIHQRKFPGPAGLLPDRSYNFNKIVETASDSEDESVPSSQGPTCSQMFESPVWQRVVADFRLEPKSPLGSCTVSWVKGRALARQLPGQKAPFLAVALGSIDCSLEDPYVILHDTTGSIPGTLHREVRELFGGQLKPGCALVLRHVGVLGTRKSSRRHYLNITSNNIISIYYPCGDADLQVVRVQEISLNELASSVHSVQSKRISENLSTVAVNSMLNSRDVNSICSVINSSTNSANNPSIVPNTKSSSSALFNSRPNNSSFKNINGHIKPNVLSQNTKNVVPIPHHVQSPQQFAKLVMPVVNSMKLNDKSTKLNNMRNNVNTFVSKQISSTLTGSSSPSATLSKGIGFRPKTSQLANLSSFSTKTLDKDIKQPTCSNEMSNISPRTSKISNSCSNSTLAVPNNSKLNTDITDENSIVHTVLGCIDTQLLFEDF